MLGTRPAQAQSLTERVTSIPAGDHVVACAFLGRTPAFALSDGSAVLADPGEERRVRLFEEAGTLTAVPDGTNLLAGSDDGHVARLSPDGAVTPLGKTGGGWIDALAASPGGAVAWASGRSVQARDDKGVVKSVQAPSTVRGLAFAPKGYRVAMAHYNGVSFWFPNAQATPEVYEWKGSHLDVTTSPDGRFLVTSMQENALHGWTVADKKHMRMSGYPSKTRSFAWSHDGQWLATSGADGAIVWPFQAKDGPMGKSPRECGVRASRVSRVAFHPASLILATGFDDGCILLCRLTDAAEILVRRPPSAGARGAPVTALAWDRTGARLAFGLEDGEAGLLSLPG